MITKKRKSRSISIVRLSTTLVLAGFLLFTSRCTESQSKSAIKANVPSFPAIRVGVKPLKKQVFKSVVQAVGKIDAEKEVSVQVPLSATITAIYVKEGDYVKKGTLIAELDDQPFLLGKHKAQVIYDERMIQYQDMMLTYSSSAADSGKLKSIENNIRILSGLASAEIAVKEASLALDRTRIYAPLTGRVANISVKAGRYSTQGEILCEIYAPEALAVSCEVLETDAFNIRVGQNSLVRSIYNSDKLTNASVISVNPRVDSGTGLVKIKSGILDPSGFYPGMSVAVSFEINSGILLSIPKEAIVIRSGKKVVFTEVNGLAKWNYVSTGKENSNDIEVTDGLRENDNIIISNNLQLAHDTPVKVEQNP